MTLDKRTLLTGGVLALGGVAVLRYLMAQTSASAAGASIEITKTEAEWRATLSPAQYAVLRDHGTERPWTSPLLEEKRAGTFNCAGCDLPLFDARTKYDSGTGWPSFYDHLPDAIGTTTDTSYFMVRTEVHCRRCGGHQGHVFDDGPQPTGLRYCINGVALIFAPANA